MSKKPYKRKPGDFEVRILSDGRMVMVAPDEELIEIAREVERRTNTETQDDATGENTEAKQDNSD
jgi:hypothetical protein